MFTAVELIAEKEKAIVKVTVNQGTKRPYYLADKGLRPSGVYVRNGTTSAPASEDSIRMMIKTTDGDSFEANRSMIQDLTFDDLSKEFDQRNLALTEVQMENLGIMSSDKIYTNMGLLVSDQCRHSIKLAIFQGKTKSVFKDRAEFVGSLFRQMEDAYRLIDFYNGTSASFHALLRTDIREALLNAVVHREYSFSGSTLINLYTDRLEIISLGGLVAGLSLEAAMMGASLSRNEKLAALFYRLSLIEAFGTGISKIMESYNDAVQKPVFENVEGAFRVTLPNMNAEIDSGLPKRESVEYEKYVPVFTLFEEQSELSRRDVERVMGVGTTQAVNIINQMTEEGLVKKVGRGKNTRYKRSL
jgi:ATP-dependent DNA helicase RecG